MVSPELRPRTPSPGTPSLKLRPRELRPRELRPRNSVSPELRPSRSRSRSLLNRYGLTREPGFEPALFSLVSELTIKRPSSSDRLSRCGERILYRLARGCQSSPGNRRSIELLRMTHVTQSDERRLWILGR